MRCGVPYEKPFLQAVTGQAVNDRMRMVSR